MKNDSIMKKLTVKQEKFAELVVKLGNQSEAYRQAYNVSEKTKTETINKRSSELMADGAISGRVAELRKQLKEEHKVDRDRIISHHFKMIEAWEELWELGKKNDKTKDEVQRFYLLKEMVKGSDYRGSLAEISKLTGLYEPEKYEHKDTSHTTEWG